MNTVSRPKRSAPRALLALCLLFAAWRPVLAVDLEIAMRIVRVPSPGTLVVALYDRRDSFPDKPLRQVAVDGNTGRGTVTLTGLAPGEYAVDIYVDSNHNGKLDLDLAGVPAEPYVFAARGQATTTTRANHDWDGKRFILPPSGVRIDLRIDIDPERGGPSAAAQAQEAARVYQVAQSHGCLACHAVHKLDREILGRKPVAPTFGDIARRYADRGDVSDQLKRTIYLGSDPYAPHWRDRTGGMTMPPNAGRVTMDEASLLARAILALKPAAPAS